MCSKIHSQLRYYYNSIPQNKTTLTSSFFQTTPFNLIEHILSNFTFVFCLHSLQAIPSGPVPVRNLFSHLREEYENLSYGFRCDGRIYPRPIR